MSVAVELAELRERVDEYGPVALVVTVGGDGRPHVVSAHVTLDGGVLVSDVGKTTAGNVERARAATLVWPAPGGSDYCLIVDGSASAPAADAGDGARRITVEPVRAVLHRVAGAPETSPSCITVLDRRG